MEAMLTKIIQTKKEWVFSKKRTFPLDIFKHEISKTDRNFYQALQSEKAVFILECKRTFTPKGLPRKKFNINEIASVYKNYANAISVSTDKDLFMGSFANLEIIRKQVEQPILCNDVLIDEYQVYLARYYQADAVSLMLSVLNNREYKKLAKVAHKFGMGILTEVSNEQELKRAINLKAKVIAINNCNINDLSVDLNITRLLAPKIPKDVTIISKYGIYKNQEVKELKNYVDGFLIGNSVLTEKNLELAMRKVFYGLNKVCGLTSVENAQKAYSAGTVYGGLVFVKESPHLIDLETAKKISRKVKLNYVGVFANDDIDEIASYAKALRLSAVQLHGDENQEYINSLKSKLSRNCQIWKAYRVEKSLPEFLENVDYHLLDSKINNENNTTITSFNWNTIKDKKNFILSKELNSENISQAIDLKFAILDINFSAELEKVFDKIRDF